jgi:hypothetical protein
VQKDYDRIVLRLVVTFRQVNRVDAGHVIDVDLFLRVFIAITILVRVLRGGERHEHES